MVLLVLALRPAPARAQEMPKGFDLLVELGQGFSRPLGERFLYLGTLQVVPQWAVVPGHLRAGVVLGAVYPGTQVGALAGGRLTLKVVSLPSFMLASAGHINVQAEYLPAVLADHDTWRQWVGVGLGLETSNTLALAVRLHRDFRTPATYGQLSVAFNLRYGRGVPRAHL